MTRSAAAERLAAAFAERGCPVCRCLDADARRDLAAYLREMTMDAGGRAALRATGGFCAWHTALLRDAVDGILSVALLAGELLDVDLARRVSCGACRALRDRADAYVIALLDEPVAWRDARGLPCRPHLRRLRAIGPDPIAVGAAEEAVARRVIRLRAGLAAFVAKQDYRRRDPPTTEEAEAWSEALEHLSGRPAIFGSEIGRP
ncbi:MAG: hypothetical protein ACREMB_27375 [Candidatus Rokuibacteriota bacterium]